MMNVQLRGAACYHLCDRLKFLISNCW